MYHFMTKACLRQFHNAVYIGTLVTLMGIYLYSLYSLFVCLILKCLPRCKTLYSTLLSTQQCTVATLKLLCPYRIEQRYEKNQSEKKMKLLIHVDSLLNSRQIKDLLLKLNWWIGSLNEHSHYTIIPPCHRALSTAVAMSYDIKMNYYLTRHHRTHTVRTRPQNWSCYEIYATRVVHRNELDVVSYFPIITACTQCSHTTCPCSV